MSKPIRRFDDVAAEERPIALARMAELHSAAFSPPWSAAEIANLIDHPGAIPLLAGSGSDAEAFALARVAADEAEVLTIVTDRAARRTGIARSLLRILHADAARRGASRMFLEVAEDNDAACRLYAGEGYAEAGRRRAYYPRCGAPAVDALVLVKPLEQG